jgi:putative PIN family toxin of toxin-antitoxin system
MRLVLDTNIVLDLFVFKDKAVDALRAAIANKEVTWLATGAMREELACVLSYEQIGARLTAAQESAPCVLQVFDAQATLVETPASCVHKCRDADDQKFIDLAVAHGARLISKDKQVLALRRKLAAVAVEVSARP